MLGSLIRLFLVRLVGSSSDVSVSPRVQTGGLLSADSTGTRQLFFQFIRVSQSWFVVLEPVPGVSILSLVVFSAMMTI